MAEARPRPIEWVSTTDVSVAAVPRPSSDLPMVLGPAALALGLIAWLVPFLASAVLIAVGAVLVALVRTAATPVIRIAIRRDTLEIADAGRALGPIDPDVVARWTPRRSRRVALADITRLHVEHDALVLDLRSGEVVREPLAPGVAEAVLDHVLPVWARARGSADRSPEHEDAARQALAALGRTRDRA